MNILVWHVHGSWMTAFVQGDHTYYTPLTPGRDANGLGRATSWTWPSSVIEVPVDDLGDLDIDAVVLQRPHEVELAEQWFARGRRRLPTVYVEHDTPMDLPSPRHPMSDRDDLVIAHVTHFNSLFWRSGSTPTTVVEHGVIDPGHRYNGELASAVAVINEPVRRSWVAGTDLVLEMRDHLPVDLFGMQSSELDGIDLRQDELHDEMARRRVYVHTFRWTSLGLTLIEAMMLGLPVVVLGTTEAAVFPADIGVVALEFDELRAGAERLVAYPGIAAETGRRARDYALSRFGVDRFLGDWDRLLDQVVCGRIAA